VRAAEVEVGVILERLLGQVQALDTTSLEADPIFLLGAVPKFGRPTTTLSSSSSSSRALAIVHLSKAMVVDMAPHRRRTAARSSGERREVTRKHLVTLNSSHRITTTPSSIKANTPSNSKALLPIDNTDLHSNAR